MDPSTVIVILATHLICSGGLYYLISRDMLNVWYSYNVHGEWVVSSNTPGWFAEEKKQGFFVTKVKFTNPKFVLIKEAYHV